MKVRGALVAAVAAMSVVLSAGAVPATPTGVRLSVLGEFTDRAILANTAFNIQQVCG